VWTLTKRRLAWAIVTPAALILAAVIARESSWTDAYWLWRSRGYFVDSAVPFKATQLLMDIGVVDANGCLSAVAVARARRPPPVGSRHVRQGKTRDVRARLGTRRKGL
jgi:hypothetical protein